ncbi:MAG: hypothetical protein QOJ19_1853 [Acidimicrobiia bacterium]|nr:hypothetical protein [Acidimicrobiia bacterium]
MSGVGFGEGVDASPYAGAALGIGLVSQGVSQGFCGMVVVDGVAGAVQLGVEGPQGEGSCGLLKERQTQCAELATEHQDGLGRRRRQGWFVDDAAAPSAATALMDGSDLFVDVAHAREQALASLGEVEQLLVDGSDFVPELVFFGEEALEAGVGNSRRATTDRDEVAAVHVWKSAVGGQFGGGSWGVGSFGVGSFGMGERRVRLSGHVEAILDSRRYALWLYGRSEWGAADPLSESIPAGCDSQDSVPIESTSNRWVRFF